MRCYPSEVIQSLGRNKTEVWPKTQMSNLWPTGQMLAMPQNLQSPSTFSWAKGPALRVRSGCGHGGGIGCHTLGGVSGVCSFLRLQRCNLCKLLSICLVHCFVRQFSADSCRLQAKNAASMAWWECSMRLYLPHFVIAFGGVKLGVPIYFPVPQVPITGGGCFPLWYFDCQRGYFPQFLGF